jgi:hypothetical protein
LPAIVCCPSCCSCHPCCCCMALSMLQAYPAEDGAGVSMHFGCDPSVAGFPSTAGVSVSTFRLFSSVAGFLLQ